MEWARKYVSMLSIRPGWGLNGSAPGENKTYNSYSSYNNLAYLGMAAFQMDGIRLTDLRSQRTNEWNIGSDFGFFGGKLSGAFNYYNRTTKDQLVSSYTIPSPTGYSSLAYKNSGSMRNQGWELNFSLNNMKLAQDFSVSFNFNVGKNYNEILELEEVLADLGDVRRIAVERLERPAAVGGGEDHLAADVDLRDLGDVKRGKDRLAVEVGRLDPASGIAEVRRSAENGGGGGENNEVLVRHFSVNLSLSAFCA
jgi:hypothetical protein